MRVFFAITLLHLTLLAIGFSLKPTPKKERTQKIIVQTLTLTPKTVQERTKKIEQQPPLSPISPPTVKTEKKPPENKPTAVKMPPSAPATRTPLPSKTKEPAPKTSAAISKPAKSSSQTQEKALKLLQDSLAKIDQTTKIAKPAQSSSNKNPSPNPPSSFSFDSDFKHSYENSIRSILKEFLHLPEWGEVKLHLILTKEGKVSAIDIVKAESEKNRAYVVKTVPKLIFPPLGVLASKNETHEFSLVIRSND